MFWVSEGLAGTWCLIAEKKSCERCSAISQPGRYENVVGVSVKTNPKTIGVPGLNRNGI